MLGEEIATPKEFQVPPGLDLVPVLGEKGRRWPTSVQIRPSYRAELRDVVVIGDVFAMVTAGGAPVKEPLYHRDAVRFLAKRLPRCRPRTRSDAPLALLLGGPGHWNYFHWTVQCLPRLALIQAGETPCLVTPPLLPFQQRYIELAGFDALPVEALQRFDIRCYERLIYGRAPPEATTELFTRIREKVSTAGGDGLLYVSRRATSRRKMLNEEELIAALQRRGFRVINPSDMPVDENIDIFSKAALVVGAHGAGMTDILYCRPGTMVYELFPSHYLNPVFFHLAMTHGLRYFGDSFEIAVTDQHPHLTPWRVDVEWVMSRIEQLLRG